MVNSLVFPEPLQPAPEIRGQKNGRPGMAGGGMLEADRASGRHRTAGHGRRRGSGTPRHAPTHAPQEARCKKPAWVLQRTARPPGGRLDWLRNMPLF